ncbi:MAG: heme transporter, partial [Byssovorax sp.]
MTDPRSTAAADRALPRASRSDFVFYGLLGVTAILTIWTIHIIFLQAPIEASMGIVQKIFYFHVPIAYSMYLGATACFIGSAGYLYNGKQGWDSFARAGAETAV